MEKYYIDIADFRFEINIEERYKSYYFNKNYLSFMGAKGDSNVDIRIIYTYVDAKRFDILIPDLRWKRAGLAGKCCYSDGKIYFLADIFFEGIAVGKKLIVCSNDMNMLEVYFNTDISKDHFYLEMMIVINSLLTKKKGGIIFHCTGAIDISKQKVYLFMGESGAGKSTIANMLGKEGSGFQVLSDDRVIVKKEDGEYLAYGTPWVSDANKKENAFGQISAIFFLHHGDREYVEEENRILQKRRLVSNIFDCPLWNSLCLHNALNFCDQLVNDLTIKSLYFALNSDLIEYFRKF